MWCRNFIVAIGVDELVHPVFYEVPRCAAWSCASLVLSSSVEDSELVALCAHIHGLQARNEDL